MAGRTTARSGARTGSSARRPVRSGSGYRRRPVRRRRNPDLIDRAIDGVGRGVARAGKGVGRGIGRTREIDAVHRRGLLGVLLLGLAVVVAAGVWFEAGGPVGRGMSTGLGAVVGLAAVLVPVLLVALGLLLLTAEGRAGGPPADRRRVAPADPRRARRRAHRCWAAHRAGPLGRRRRSAGIPGGRAAGQRAPVLGGRAGAGAPVGLRRPAAHRHPGPGPARPGPAPSRPGPVDEPDAAGRTTRSPPTPIADGERPPPLRRPSRRRQARATDEPAPDSEGVDAPNAAPPRAVHVRPPPLRRPGRTPWVRRCGSRCASRLVTARTPLPPSDLLPTGPAPGPAAAPTTR